MKIVKRDLRRNAAMFSAALASLEFDKIAFAAEPIKVGCCLSQPGDCRLSKLMSSTVELAVDGVNATISTICAQGEARRGHLELWVQGHVQNHIPENADGSGRTDGLVNRINWIRHSERFPTYPKPQRNGVRLITPGHHS